MKIFKNVLATLVVWTVVISIQTALLFFVVPSDKSLIPALFLAPIGVFFTKEIWNRKEPRV